MNLRSGSGRALIASDVGSHSGPILSVSIFLDFPRFCSSHRLTASRACQTRISCIGTQEAQVHE